MVDSLIFSSAAHTQGRVELEPRSRGCEGRTAGALAEDVEEPEHRDDRDEREQATPKPDVLPPALQAAVPLEDDRVGDVRHVEGDSASCAVGLLRRSPSEVRLPVRRGGGLGPAPLVDAVLRVDLPESRAAKPRLSGGVRPA